MAATSGASSKETDDDFTKNLRGKLDKCAELSVLLIFQHIGILFFCFVGCILRSWLVCSDS